MQTSTVGRNSLLLALSVVVLFCVGSARAVAPPPQDRVAVVMDETAPLMSCLLEAGVPCISARTPLEAMTNGYSKILIVDASPDNLRHIVESPQALAAFTGTGGWVILCGLFPDGLVDFNRIVGVNHLIRSFEMEDVRLTDPVDPLLQGLRSADLFFESGEWSDGPDAIPMRSSDMFTYVVDYDDIAPFSTLPKPAYWGLDEAAPGTEHWPPNMINGLTYHACFGFAIVPGRNQPLRWPIAFPRPERVVGFAWAPDDRHNAVREVTLDFGDGGAPVILAIAATAGLQEITFAPRLTQCLTVAITRWNESGAEDVVAVRNIAIAVQRDAAFRKKVKPLFSVGGLVKYPMGRGGVILNQLHILDKESSPVNGAKKRRIAHTLLHNLQDCVRTAD